MEDVQVLYIKDTDGKIYFNYDLKLDGEEKEKLMQEAKKNKYLNIKSFKEDKTSTYNNKFVGPNVVVDPTEPGAIRIVIGSTSVSNPYVVTQTGINYLSMVKGLLLTVLAIKFGWFAFALGVGDTLISNALNSSYEVNASTTYKSRTMRKVGEYYNGSSWVKKAEFQRWEEYWDMNVYTYNSSGAETGAYRYSSYPGATTAYKVMPNVPTKERQYPYYSDVNMMTAITDDLYRLGQSYTVYSYTNGTLIQNSTYWTNYINSNS